MMKKIIFLLSISVLATACSGETISTPETSTSNGETRIENIVSVETNTNNADDIVENNFMLEAWSDNWFAMYNDGELVVEDSVSINTERSFNAETVNFTAQYPMELAFLLKDFKENDSGLEYIGENNQQMGDGGFIMQITDTDSGEKVAVSNDSMKCMVIHTAPLDTSCEKAEDTSMCGFESLEEPDDWKLASFDDSSWENATIHSASDVSPKDGYDDINWDSTAELVWGSDLETHNTILCRLTVENPSNKK